MSTLVPPDASGASSPLPAGQAARRIPSPRLTRGVAVEMALALISAVIAAAIVVVLVRHVPVTDQAHTDIVGYPIFADFNASAYPDIWYPAVIGWPLFSVLIFLLGRWLLRAVGLVERMRFALHAGRARPAPVPVPVEVPIDPGSLTERVALGARVAAVALVWDFAAAIDFYVTLMPGHDLEGTIPISFAPLTGQFLYWILAPGAAALLAFVILATRVRLRLTLRTNHFLMIAAGIFTVLYYAAEFLSRADPTHAELSYGAAIPLVILCAWEAARWLNRWVRAQLQGSRAGGLLWPLFYVAAALAGITSKTLPGGEVSYRFPIGACTQWHGHSLPTLRLSSSVPVTITRVELLP